MSEKAMYDTVATMIGFTHPREQVSTTNAKDKATYDSVAMLMGLVYINASETPPPMTVRKVSFQCESRSITKETAMYDSVAKLMGIEYAEKLNSTPPSLDRKSFKSQDGNNLWRPILGSAAWRDYRRSRRRLLRGSMIEKNPIAAEEVKIDQTNLNRLESLPEDNFMELTEVPKSGLSTYTSSAANDPPSLLSRESSFLITEIEMLERLLDKQEDELDELEEELSRCQEKNGVLKDDLAKKRAALSQLEDKYAKLKVELADSKANEHNLQLELSQKAMVRDLEVINLTNEFNQLVVYMKRLEKERESALQQISLIEKGSNTNEAELANSAEKKKLFFTRSRQ